MGILCFWKCRVELEIWVCFVPTISRWVGRIFHTSTQLSLSPLPHFAATFWLEGRNAFTSNRCILQHAQGKISASTLPPHTHSYAVQMSLVQSSEALKLSKFQNYQVQIPNFAVGDNCKVSRNPVKLFPYNIAGCFFLKSYITNNPMGLPLTPSNYEVLVTIIYI